MSAGAAVKLQDAGVYLRAYLAPLTGMLARPDVTDIYVNRPGEIWAETTGGAIERHDAPGLDAATLREAAPLMGTLARASITVDPGAVRPPQSALAVAQGAEVYVRLEGVVDLAAERQRLGKEIDKAAKEIAFLEGKLARPDFVERAPADILARERERLSEQYAVREKLTASLAALT